MKPDPELLALCGAARDGTLTREQLCRLERRLSEDAQARRFYAEFAQLHVLLDRVHVPRTVAAVPQGWLATIQAQQLWALAACFAVVALGAWFWQAQRHAAQQLATVERAVKNTPAAKAPATIARLAAFDGEVQVKRAGRRVAVGVDVPLQSGDEIRTAGTASVRIQYAGEATWVELAGDTVLELDETPSGKRLTLRQGRFKADVAPQPAGQPMVCRTPQADALVLGTVFTLAAWSDQTFLNVEHGVVRLSQGDGSAQDVKAGEAARAALGAPVRTAPYLGVDPPLVERISQPWIQGPLDLQPGGTLAFDFETKPKLWGLVNGSRWQSATPSTPGHLILTGAEPGGIGYKVVSPYVSVGPSEVIRVTGKAKHSNAANLRLQYYLCDSSPKCFGFLDVKARVSSDSSEFVPFQIEFTLPRYADLRFIAFVLYCQHADRTAPQEGDTILVDELSISRSR